MRSVFWSAILAVFPLAASSTLSAQEAAAPQQQEKPAQPQETGASKTGDAAPTDPAKVAVNAAAAAAAVDNSIFVIGAKDQLFIRVWGDDRLSGNFLVRPDGRISMNLAGDIMASGRTPEKLSRDIEDLLKQKEILTRPLVTVQVTAVGSKEYSINGEVNHPGAFPLMTPTRVFEALVNAGGFRDFADKKHIVIIRGNQRFIFNWNDVIKGKRTEQNIFLEPGDIIIVK